jgi:hypothetical protein
MEIAEALRTGCAALLFAAVFAVGGSAHPLQRWVDDRRSIVSFGAGMSAAYVFVHVMPELHGARTVVSESVEGLRFDGMATYFLALIGFLVFYGLEHLGKRGREHGPDEALPEVESASPAYRIHVGGFAIYIWLMGYLLVHNLEGTPLSTLLFGTAIAFHLLSVEHSLRTEYGATYARRGRYLLAVMAPLGWLAGQLVTLPRLATALMVAFVSGAVIVNSAVMELPDEKDGRFLPFLAGGLIYGSILLPFG